MGLCQKPLLPPTKTHLRYNNEKAVERIKTKPRYFGLTLSSKVSLSDSPQNNPQTQIPIFFWDFSPFLSLTLTSLSLTNPWEMLLGGAVGKKPFPAGEAAPLPRWTRFPSGCQHHLSNPSPSHPHPQLCFQTRENSRNHQLNLHYSPYHRQATKLCISIYTHWPGLEEKRHLMD